MQLGYRGSVNRWECDENDHLNVRFFIDKHMQTLLGASTPLSLELEDVGLPLQIHSQHLKFLAEARLATPLSGYAGIVACGENWVQVLTELRHSFTEEVLCTCIHKVKHNTRVLTDDLPNYASPRGVTGEVELYNNQALAKMPGFGFLPISQGTVNGQEVNADGLLCVHQYMARISDGMPHLWGHTYANEDGKYKIPEDQGGAVLEFRVAYHTPLRLGQSFVVYSGILQVGRKVQNFAHMFFNVSTGVLCASAEAVAVRMDLNERRAVTLTPDIISQLHRLQLKRP